MRDQEAYDKELAFYLRAMGIGDLVVGGKDSGNLTPVLKEQAERDNVLAQYQLGMSYAAGIGVTASEDEAIRWFERAASHGELRSKNIVAGEWLYGDKDYPVEKKLLGVEYLVDLAASGETWAPAQIIDIYKDGSVSGIPADYDKMVEYAAMYAQQGYLYAAHILAEVCDTARGPEVSRPYKDDAQAALLYNMILENEKCDYIETAAMCLADMYRTGRGVAENVEQAIACYRQASSYGNMEAKLALLELFSQTLENEESRTEIRTLARQLKGSGSAPLNAAAVYFLYRVEDAEEQYGKAMKLARQYVADPCAEAQKTEETKAYLAKMEEHISQMSEEERRTFLKERKKLFENPLVLKGVVLGIAAVVFSVLVFCFARAITGRSEYETIAPTEAWAVGGVDEGDWEIELDSLEGTYWSYGEGFTLGSSYVMRFYANGMYDGFSLGAGGYISGRYSYAGSSFYLDGMEYRYDESEDCLVAVDTTISQGLEMHRHLGLDSDGTARELYEQFARESGLGWQPADSIGQTANVLDIFNETYWRLIVGVSNSGAYNIKFHEDGTYDGFQATTGDAINGVYSYDGEILTIDGDHPYWGDGRIEFCYDEAEDIFSSIESINLDGTSFRYALWPDEDGLYQEMYEQSASEYGGYAS